MLMAGIMARNIYRQPLAVSGQGLYLHGAYLGIPLGGRQATSGTT